MYIYNMDNFLQFNKTVRNHPVCKQN